MKLKTFLSLGRSGALRSHMRGRRQAKFESYALSKRALSNTKFIAITGSAGKSTCAAIIAHLLKQSHKVKAQVIDNLYNGLLGTLASLEDDVEFVVAEAAVAQLGDMTPQAKALKPDVSVVTLVGLEHKSAFKNLKNIAKEKSQLVAETKSTGTVVLNIDDPNVWEMKNYTQAQIISFGTNEMAEYQVKNTTYEFGKNLSISLRIGTEIHGFEIPLNGTHFGVSATAAIVVAHQCGLSIDEIKQTLRTFEPVFSRCSLYKPTGGPTFLLDTVKAPHYSLSLFYKLITPNTIGRNIVIIGQVSDFPRDFSLIYGQIYSDLREIADLIVFVGQHSHRSGASEEDCLIGKFKAFQHVAEAAAFIKDYVNDTDRIFIKGSANLHLERIAMSFNHRLRCTTDVCGESANCYKCGLIEYDPKEHLEQMYTLGRRRRPKFQSHLSKLQKLLD